MVAEDDDPCTELGIFSSGLVDDGLMALGGLTYDSSNRVRRVLTWEAPVGSSVNTALDTRPEDAVVCFYPFDAYLVGAYRCVHLVLPKCANMVTQTGTRVTTQGQVRVDVAFSDCDGSALANLDCDSILTLREDSSLMPRSSWKCLPRVRVHVLMLDLSLGTVPTPAPTPEVKAGRRRSLLQAPPSTGADVVAELRAAVIAYVNWVYDQDCFENRVWGIYAFAGPNEIAVIKDLDPGVNGDSREKVRSRRPVLYALTIRCTFLTS
jgi:hypothetical protein